MVRKTPYADGAQCDEADCAERPIANGVCKRHYYARQRAAERARRPAQPPVVPLICSIEGCASVVASRGWCGSHYQRWRRFGDPEAFPTEKRKRCSVEGCDRVTNARGFCHRHYYRWQTYGDPLVSKYKPSVREFVPDLPPRACATCGREFDPGRSYVRRYCNRRCRPTRAAAGVNNRATVERLAHLHGWTCALCLQPIDPDIYWPNVRAGSVDHVRAVIEGGLDDSANLQLTHLACNLKKEAERKRRSTGR